MIMRKKMWLEVLISLSGESRRSFVCNIINYVERFRTSSETVDITELNIEIIRFLCIDCQ